MRRKDQPIAPRDAFGLTLAELAATDERIVALDADLASSTKLTYFRDAHPDRFFQLGIAEQNMVGVAAGLALMGRIPFCATFATFMSRRSCDQNAILVGHTRLNVKLVGSYGGLVSGNNGATHQAVEDLAIVRSIPNFVVVEPADDLEMAMAVREIVSHDGPVYLRCTRDAWPRVSAADYQFKLGRAVVIRPGKDVTLIGVGMMVSQCLEAVELLAHDGLEAEVLNMPTIKPLDLEALVASAGKTGAVVTAENHSIIGGLGGAVAEALVENLPVPMGRIGLKDVYGECGDNASLLRKYEMDARAIADKARTVLSRSNHCQLTG